MTLAKIIDTLKMIALKHPNINSAYEGNIYDILNAKPDNKYASVVITQQSHTTDETYDHYGFVIFYVDRLLNDLDENRVQIQSIGKSMLGNIITAFCNEFEAECDNIIYQPFTQRFADETAGVYCTITIDTVKDAYCAERYWDESWTAPIVSIKNVDKALTITENGHYVLDYDPTVYTGIGKVDIDVDFNTEPFYNEGYEQGKTDGVNEQKGKLESINITENGRYTKEDGYNEIVVDVPDLNGSYDEGYEQGKTDGEQEGYNSGYDQGQADIAANARVLDVTENGNYLSKFSDPIIPANVTGVYANGTDFYSYAELTNIVYNTGIKVSENTKIEIWYKPRDLGFVSYGGIIGPIEDTSDNAFNIHTYIGDGFNDSPIGDVFNGRIKFYNSYYKPNDLNKWFHLELSFADGFIIDGVVVGTYTTNTSNYGRDIYINKYTETADGYYGMIKIDDTIIIPTEEGFLNTSTSELLEVVQNGSYTYTNNEIIQGEGELYKTINVNVLPKINVQKTGLKLGYSRFTEVPEWVDFEGIKDMSCMFENCYNLQTIPEIDTSNVTNMEQMFRYCYKLQTIPLLDTSNVVNMYAMLSYCSELQTIPEIDTSNATNMEQMFANSGNLQTIPPLNTSKVTNMYNMFGSCWGLTSLPALNAQSLNMPSYQGVFGYSELSNLTDFGGFLNLKCSLTNDSNLKRLPNLTYESCINVLNGLYDFTGNGETPNSNQGKLKVHPNFLTTVGEEISIGTNKGWTITA